MLPSKRAEVLDELNATDETYVKKSSRSAATTAGRSQSRSTGLTNARRRGKQLRSDRARCGCDSASGSLDSV